MCMIMSTNVSCNTHTHSHTQFELKWVRTCQETQLSVAHFQHPCDRSIGPRSSKSVIKRTAQTIKGGYHPAQSMTSDHYMTSL